MDQLIGIDELAEFLGIPKATLYDWRKRGRGPAAYRLGKHLRWRLSEVEAWLAPELEGGKGRRGEGGVTPAKPATQRKSSESVEGEKAARTRVRKSGPPGDPPPLDRARLSRVARNVEILSVDLLGAHFEREDDDALPRALSETTPEFVVSVEWKMNDNEGLLGCVLTFGTAFEEKKPPYEVIARFRLLYAVNPEIRFTRAELDQFVHWNALFNAWPYWREYLSSTVNRGHLPQFVAPVMQVPMPAREAPA